MRRIAVILFLINFFEVFGQYQMAPKHKWYQLESNNFKIIYPQGYYGTANFVANVLEDIYQLNTESFGVRPKNIPVVLNPFTAYSNAYATILPLKMHWYLMPYSETYLGINDWLVDLALHEFRHIAQFYAFRKGLWNINYWLFGNIGWGSAMMYSTPMWFFEGDAVFQETVLSKTGRGRIANFQMPVMAIALTYPKKKLNYYKFYLGSYKTYYPSWYHLGYYLVSYFNTNIGYYQWQKVFKYSSLFMFLPNSLNIGLQLSTKYSYKKLFDSTFATLKTQWTKLLDTTQYQQNFIAHQKNKVWTNYIEPQLIYDSILITVKYGYDNIPEIVSPNKKDYLWTQIPTYHISSAKDKAVWLNLRVNPRWQDETFKQLVIFNFSTKRKKFLIKDKFDWVNINKNADQILLLKLNNDLTYSLVIIDTNGNYIQQINLPQFRQIRHPQWTPNNKIIFTATDLYRGIGLFIIDPNTLQIDTLINFTWNGTIERPIVYDTLAIFSSDVKGVNQIFAISLNSKQIYKLTSVPFGAYMPFVHKNKLYFADYTPNGFEINHLELDKLSFKPVDFSPSKYEFFKSELTESIIRPYFPDTANFINFPTKKYNHFTLKPMGWLYLIDYYNWLVNDQLAFIGGIYLGDLLYETMFGIGASYNYSANSLQLLTELYYGRYFPVINAGLLYSSDSAGIKVAPVVGFNIPLNFSRDVWNRFFDFELNFSTNYEDKKFENEVSFSTSFINYKRLAYRDVQSRSAQYFGIDGRFTKEGFSNQVSGIVSVGGIFKHDVLTLALAYGAFYGKDSLRFNNVPLGWKEKLSFKRYYRATVFYHYPLLYPDFGYYRVFYVKRLRNRLFYDILYDQNWKKYSSVGLQIWADFDLFGLRFDLTSGLQFSYLIEKQKFSISPLFNLSLPF